jgi:hypothetical protein
VTIITAASHGIGAGLVAGYRSSSARKPGGRSLDRNGGWQLGLFVPRPVVGQGQARGRPGDVPGATAYPT